MAKVLDRFFSFLMAYTGGQFYTSGAILQRISAKLLPSECQNGKVKMTLIKSSNSKTWKPTKIDLAHFCQTVLKSFFEIDPCVCTEAHTCTNTHAHTHAHKHTHTRFERNILYSSEYTNFCCCCCCFNPIMHPVGSDHKYEWNLCFSFVFVLFCHFVKVCVVCDQACANLC